MELNSEAMNVTKKIYIVAGNGNRSGVPSYVSNLYKTFSKNYDLKVVADNNDGGFDEIPEQNLIIIRGLASERNFVEKFIALIRLYFHLKEANIVWANSSFSILFARLIKLFAKYKLIITYHGLPFGMGRPWLISKIAFLVEFITIRVVEHKIIVISKYDEQNLKELYPKADFFYIPNCVNIVTKKNKRYNGGKVSILMTTRDCYQKNLDYAVQLLNSIPECKLDVYGSITQSREELLLSQNTANNITFHGEVPRSEINFSNYNVYLMTSRYEGFSLGLLEACAMGLAIISTNVGGALEVSRYYTRSAILSGDIHLDCRTLRPTLKKLLQLSETSEFGDEFRGLFSYSRWQEDCNLILRSQI